MTETPEQVRARGLAKMNEVYGWDMPDQKGDFFAVTADHLFAEIWTRPGLDVQQRRLMLIGALAATRNFEILAIQLDSAYRLGELDATALHEIVIFLAHYLGWPVAATLNTHVETLIAKAAGG
jgi:4-carboxymuconolactone decarboxylase